MIVTMQVFRTSAYDLQPSSLQQLNASQKQLEASFTPIKEVDLNSAQTPIYQVIENDLNYNQIGKVFSQARVGIYINTAF